MFLSGTRDLLLALSSARQSNCSQLQSILDDQRDEWDAWFSRFRETLADSSRQDGGGSGQDSQLRTALQALGKPNTQDRATPNVATQHSELSRLRKQCVRPPSLVLFLWCASLVNGSI